jgi:hypothetical protein
MDTARTRNSVTTHLDDMNHTNLTTTTLKLHTGTLAIYHIFWGRSINKKINYGLDDCGVKFLEKQRLLLSAQPPDQI